MEGKAGKEVAEDNHLKIKTTPKKYILPTTLKKSLYSFIACTAIASKSSLDQKLYGHQ